MGGRPWEGRVSRSRRTPPRRADMVGLKVWVLLRELTDEDVSNASQVVGVYEDPQDAKAAAALIPEEQYPLIVCREVL
jgi:hypothetical protein